jgi:hypothetical protein
MRRNSSLFRRMRPKRPSFWRIMAQEIIENERRIRRTPRATQPVCVRIFPISVAKIAVNRKMMYPSVRADDM